MSGSPTAINARLCINLIIGICLIGNTWGQGSTFCDVTYLGSLGHGAIASPNFPFDYYNYRTCEYKIMFRNVNTVGKHLCFKFKRFRLEDNLGWCADSLQFPGSNFYCGEGHHQGELTNSLGNVFNDDFCWDITGDEFVIEFYSDAEGNSTGFYAEFELVSRSNGYSKMVDIAPQIYALNIDSSEEYLEGSISADSSADSSADRSADRSSDRSADRSAESEESEEDDEFKKPRIPYWQYYLNKTLGSSRIWQTKAPGTLKCPSGACSKSSSTIRRYPPQRQSKLPWQKPSRFQWRKHRKYPNNKHRRLPSYHKIDHQVYKHRQAGKHRRRPRSVENICTENEWRCWNGNCIDINLLCNLADDCGDNSDETYQHARCPDAVGIGACDFEAEGTNYLCNFTSDSWRRDVQSPNGPRFDHTIGAVMGPGRLMYTNYIFGETVSLIHEKSLGTETYPRCLSFWYFMSGTVGSLMVQFNLDPVNDNLIKAWFREGNQKNDWIQGQIEIPANFQDIHETRFISESLGRFGQIGLDDIALLDTPCYSSDISCTFELGTCGWANDENDPMAELNWIRWYGSTVGSQTGPQTDADGNPQGYYMYLDSSTPYPSYGIFISPPASSNANAPGICISLDYHMYGRDIIALKVRIRDHEGTVTLLQQIISQQGDQWFRLNIPRVVYNAYQIIIEGTTNGPLANMAIDNFHVHTGTCEVRVSSTTYVPTPAPTCNPSQFMCRDGTCIASQYRCDSVVRCPDGSDEEDCPENVNLALVIGVTCAVMVFFLIIGTLALVFFKRRLNLGAGQRRDRRFDMNYNDDVVTPASVGDPPPLYDEAWDGRQGRRSGSVISVDGPVPRITISLSWEPPPAYNFDDSYMNYGPDVTMNPGSDLAIQPPIYTISDRYNNDPPPQYQPPPEDIGILQRIRANVTGAPRGRESSNFGPSSSQANGSPQSLNATNRNNRPRSNPRITIVPGNNYHASRDSLQSAGRGSLASHNSNLQDPNSIQTISNNTGSQNTESRSNSRPSQNGRDPNDPQRRKKKRPKKRRQIETQIETLDSQVPRGHPGQLGQGQGQVSNPGRSSRHQQPHSGVESARRTGDDALSLCGDLDPNEIEGVRSVRRSRVEADGDNLSMAREERHSRETVV